MLTRDLVEALAGFDAHGASVLSVYLDLDPARQVRRSYQIGFKDLVKEARGRLPEPRRDDLDREVAIVQAWLDTQPPRGKGLALFSCTERSWFQAPVLAVRVRDHLAFEAIPDVGPLLQLLDEHERYAVVAVDKTTARIFSVFVGEIEERETLEDEEVPSKHDQGGLSQSRYQRHHETHLRWHLKRVVQRLVHLDQRRRFDRLIILGPEEATTDLRRLLPRPLDHRLAAVLPAPQPASDHGVLEATLETERRIEREAEERVLAQLLDQAGPGGGATLGVGPTLDAVWAEVVQTLVVADSASAEGSECPNCARLERGRVTTCQACGHPMRPVHDLFHCVIFRTLDQAGRVEVVHGDVERRLWDVGEGLGAILRYGSPAVPVARGT